jgi:RNA polymerase sigma-70 factor (ECF subfamily)
MADSGSLVLPPLAQEVAPACGIAAPDLRALVEAHGDFVWRSLRRLGVPESLADDATQQVFLTTARKVDRIEHGRERAFLFATLSHVAAHVRRTLARKREVAYEAIDEAADPSTRPDVLLEARQARALLDVALDSLSLEHRIVFVLFELEELTAVEIAELTGLPVGTVASRLRRARDEFRKAVRRIHARTAGPARGEP